MLNPNIDRLLLPGERVRLTASPHLVALLQRLVVRAVQIVAAAQLGRLARSSLLAQLFAIPMVSDAWPAGAELVPLWIDRLGSMLMALAAAAAVLDWLRWDSSRFVLTDQRVLRVRGLLGRETLDLPLDSIHEAVLVQGFLGRRLDYGDLVFLRPGDEGGNALTALSRPLAFRQALHAARLPVVRSLYAPPPASASPERPRPGGQEESNRARGPRATAV